MPDWAAVAAEFDGVHLSWAGFLSAEGYVSDLDGDDVTMLRYWFSERTLWLRDVFGEPIPLEAPNSDSAGVEVGVDVRHDTTLSPPGPHSPAIPTWSRLTATFGGWPSEGCRPSGFPAGSRGGCTWCQQPVSWR